ncbi:hypothetical protein SUGI_0602540 [Cryptomeria japonica]|nr:hypothetical protein SUGI_0602540 [Cryptomeria japonica]
MMNEGRQMQREVAEAAMLIVRGSGFNCFHGEKWDRMEPGRSNHMAGGLGNNVMYFASLTSKVRHRRNRRASATCSPVILNEDEDNGFRDPDTMRHWK